MKDTESEVCFDILRRQQLGIRKYGTTVAENPLELHQWLTHAYEEVLDQAVYLKRAIQEIDSLMGNRSDTVDLFSGAESTKTEHP